MVNPGTRFSNRSVTVLIGAVRITESTLMVVMSFPTSIRRCVPVAVVTTPESTVGTDAMMIATVTGSSCFTVTTRDTARYPRNVNVTRRSPTGTFSIVNRPVADVVAVRSFRQHAQWNYIWRMLPATLVGILAGFVLMGRLDERLFSPLIGVIVLLLVVLQVVRMARPSG